MIRSDLEKKLTRKVSFSRRYFFLDGKRIPEKYAHYLMANGLSCKEND